MGIEFGSVMPLFGGASMSSIIRFEDRAPSAQTAVDVFRDRWACDLGPLLGVDGTGLAPLYTQDHRPLAAAKALGRADYEGLHILEIGPLEAAHTYRLEQMGAASVTCIEASVEAWLKCLVVKEVLGLSRSTFHLGDIGGFLADNKRRFDLVYCSGVLYHLSDPVDIIRGIAAITDRCFVWTHIYDPQRHPVKFVAEPVERLGIQIDYWTHQYGSKDKNHWGGIDPVAAWLTRNDLLRAFEASGLSDIQVIEDQPDHPNGPAILLTASRRLAMGSVKPPVRERSLVAKLVTAVGRLRK